MPARRVTKKKTSSGKDKAGSDAQPGLLDKLMGIFKKKAPEKPAPVRRRQTEQPIPPP
jgi:hypothetical protein